MTTPTSAVDVRPEDRRDRKLIKLLLAHLGRLHGLSWASLDFPEDRIWTRDAVQVIAMEPSGRVTAVEHVVLDGLAGHTQDVQRLLAFAALEREPSLRVPGFHVELGVPVVSAPDPADSKLLVSGLRGWCERHLQILAEGHGAHVIMVSTVPFRFRVEKTACPGEAGRLWVTRSDPPRNFEAVVHDRLQHKLARLVTASADKRIMLIEKSDSPWNLEQLRLELEGASLEFPALNALTEIWLADTREWETDDYVAFRRVLRNEDE